MTAVITGSAGLIGAEAARFFANKGMDLGLDATWEDIAENADEILDVSSANLKTTFWFD